MAAVTALPNLNLTLFKYSSCLNIFEKRFGHTPAIYAGVLADECSEMLREFFKKIR